jgi:hypothetical protein
MALPTRSHDPFDIPITSVPKGMSYQWCAKTICGDPNPQWQRMVDAGWWPVPGKRHPGMKVNADGDVEIGGQMLMWRMEHETAAARGREFDAVIKQMDDWAARAGAAGLSGGVRMQVQAGRGSQSTVSPAFERRIGDPALAENITAQQISQNPDPVRLIPKEYEPRKSLLARIVAWFKKGFSK